MTDAAALLDTSCIVRYLTDDPPAMAAAAARIIDSDAPLLVSELVLAETAYVLESVYEYPRATVVDALLAFLQRRNIRPYRLPKTLLLRALRMCRDSGRYSYADVLLWAQAHAGQVPVYSFDRRFPKDGIEVLDPSG